MTDAMDLTAAGLRVFPVKPDGTPGVQGFPGDRPYPASVVRGFPWDDASQIGVALPQDQIALDIDVKDGKEGDIHLAQLESALGELPPALARRTRSGGWHLLFFRGEIPDDAGLASHCVLPDGTYAHIDIVHRGNRYLRVHDVWEWLANPLPMSSLRAEWLPGLLKPMHARVTPGSAGAATHGTTQTLDELVAEVAQAKEFRNDCLNRNLYLALIQGNAHPSVIELFREAAIDCRLDPDEIERTIASALRAATVKQSFAVAWCRAVADHPLLNGSRRRNTCMAIATIFARHYLSLPGTPLISMSLRRLSEECGISPKGILERLRDFKKAGLLVAQRRSIAVDATEYHLCLPSSESPSGNTYPPTPLGYVLPEGDLFPTLDAQDLLKAKMLAGAAFIRLGDGPVFTPTCVDVLIVLLAGPMKRAGIAHAARRSWGAVDRAVLILHSAGIVGFDTTSGLVHLLTSDLMAAVDDWATAMGVIIRPEIRKLMHQKEREAFRSYIEESSRVEPAGHESHD